MNVMLEVTGLVRKSRSFDYRALAALPGQIEDVAAGYANSPIELPARYDAVHDRMLREIERRL